MTLKFKKNYNRRRNSCCGRWVMEGLMILKAVLSLAFVLGLMLLTLWAIKYCQLHGAKNKFMRKLGENQRLQVLENRRLDARNSLVLFKKDDKEYLLLLGATQNLLIESEQVKKVQK